ARRIRSGPHDEAVLPFDVRLRVPQGQRLSAEDARRSDPEKIKIGVHILGEDYSNPPPVHELAKRGVVDNVVGFDTFYSSRNPPSAIIDAVADGKIDAAIVWGPAAGYFVLHQTVPMAMVPIPSQKGDLPFAFDISMGVKKGDDALFERVEKALD